MQNTTRQHDTQHPYYATHPYAEILRAIADGKKIQFYSAGWCGIWLNY